MKWSNIFLSPNDYVHTCRQVYLRLFLPHAECTTYPTKMFRCWNWLGKLGVICKLTFLGFLMNCSVTQLWRFLLTFGWERKDLQTPLNSCPLSLLCQCGLPGSRLATLWQGMGRELESQCLSVSLLGLLLLQFRFSGWLVFSILSPYILHAIYYTFARQLRVLHQCITMLDM